MARQMERFLELLYIYLGYGGEAREGVWKKEPQGGRSLGEPSVTCKLTNQISLCLLWAKQLPF